MDYRDHRPDLNPKLFELLASGIGLRQSSRLLGLSRRCLELKHRKIGRDVSRVSAMHTANSARRKDIYASPMGDKRSRCDGRRAIELHRGGDREITHR